jgi:hypothetical protein
MHTLLSNVKPFGKEETPDRLANTIDFSFATAPFWKSFNRGEVNFSGAILALSPKWLGDPKEQNFSA